MTEPARHLQLVPTADAPADPLVGALIDGRYRVEAVLGAGGMGLVYRARHATLGKLLAIKVLKPEVSRSADVMERFRREAQAASAIGSPHICDVSDFGALPDGSTYFVMEYLDGPSLTAAIESERPLPAERVLSIARQLCDALGAAHARGIVHRDLKPDNVHLVPRGSERDFVKVLDFGIAKIAGGADKKLTQAGQIFGTPHYMSPEQCSGREVDLRTDVYALGVMLYEMATGRVPFDADTLMGVLTKHVYELPVPPHELVAGAQIPAGLEAIILKCLAKQPRDRYASMSALAADLDALARGRTTSAVAERVDRAAPARVEPAPRPIVPATPERRRSKAPIALALATLAVLGAGAFAAARLASEDPAADPTPAADRATEGVDDGVIAREERPRETDAVVDDPAEPDPVQAVVTVRLETDPAGAMVYDSTGALIGNTPITLPRPADGAPAQYRVALRGHREESFAVSASTQERVRLHLERERRGRGRDEPAVPTADPGVTSTPPTSTPTTTTTPVIDDLIDPFRDQPRR